MIRIEDAAPAAMGRPLAFEPGQVCQALNPVADFAQEPLEVLMLLEVATGYNLTEAQRASAADAGCRAAEQGVPTFATLANQWVEIPELVEFAQTVRCSFLPT